MDSPEINQSVSVNIQNSGNKMRASKMVIVALILLALSCAAAAGYLLMNQGNLKTIEYDNGKDNRYSLKFYKEYSTRDFKLSANSTETFNALPKQLVATHGFNSKAPLVAFISVVDSTDESAKEYSNNSCGSRKEVSKVRNKNFNKQVPICILSGTEDKVHTYIAPIENNGKLHSVVITQNTTEEDRTSKSNVIGAQEYLPDIQAIVSSIKQL